MGLFQDSEETIHIAEIVHTSYERAACFHWDEAKRKKNASSQWKQAARSFISALWMVSSESWKRLHPN